MCKNACLFPFSEETLLMLKYKVLIKDYSIKYTAALPGHSNGFISDINNCDVEYINIWNDAVCENFDTIIVPSNYVDTYNEDVKNRLLSLEKLGKEIVPVGESSAFISHKMTQKSQIFPISACVIFITGLGPHIQKNELTIELYNRFNANGISVEVVSSYVGASIMGFHEFPNFMYYNNIDECNKMIKFNHFIKDIDSKNPDIIIICLPGSVMPYPDETDVSNCGVLHFMISNIVPPDYVCCNLYAKEYSEYELIDIIEMSEKRMGKSLDGLVISDFAIDWVAYNDIITDGEIQFFPLSTTIVDRYVHNFRSNVKEINVYSMRSINDLYNNIMQCFHGDTRNFQIL